MNKKITLILIILGIVFTIVGVTISYYIWSTTESERTLVTFTVNNDFSCSADGGGNISSSDVVLIPTEVNDGTTANYIKREVNVYMRTISGMSVYLDLWLDVNSIGAGLTNTDYFKYVLTTSSTSPTDGVISSGTFRGTSAGSDVILLGKREYTGNITETYYLWIWLDAEETDSATMNQTFSLSLGGKCSDKLNETVALTENINVDIPNGLIPVVLRSDGTVTRSNTDSSWANYDNKIWANAVLVKESGTNTREYYQNSTGAVILEDDILAYFVYVPRYKYKIWTTELSSTGNEQEIEIVFETKDTEKSTATAVNEYLTHPAFTFGSEELNGIWVGKFETTGSASAPTIKPSVLSLRNQNASTQFSTSKIFETSTYGLAVNNDTHMAKNSEWGAVAYLSHSKYGRCTDGVCEEIRRNNNSGYYTGYSAVNVATTGYSTTSSSTNEFGTNTSVTQPYNTEVGYLASTTGNISGVYDLSGGNWERVMGSLDDGNGYPTIMLSGFTLSTFPDSKYYETFTSSDASSNSSALSLTACNGGVCYGHALSESAGWYNDTSIFFQSPGFWFSRGGRFSHGINAGIFFFNTDRGRENENNGFRTILVVDNG